MHITQQLAEAVKLFCIKYTVKLEKKAKKNIKGYENTLIV